MPDEEDDIIVQGTPGVSTVFLVEDVSPAGADWIAEHLPEDAMTLGKNVVVEHRYIEDIVNGMINDGLRVRCVG